MTIQYLTQICSQYQIGELTEPAKEVTGGLVNKTYEMTTKQGQFIVKLINLNSARARTIDEYRYIEQLTQYCSDQGIPTVTALRQHDDYILPLTDNDIAIVYPWISGKVLYGPIGPVPAIKSKIAGKILAQIHKLHIINFIKSKAFAYNYHIPKEEWQKYYKEAQNQQATWLTTLNLQQLLDWNQQYEQAQQRLNLNMIYSHGDYFPHNLMFENNKATLIDWELAGLINPGMEYVLGLILFSGFTTPETFNRDAMQAFHEGYHQTGSTLCDDAEDAYWSSLGKGWLNWIAYNMKRSVNIMLNQQQRTEASKTVIDLFDSLSHVVTNKSRFLDLLHNLI